MGSGIFATVDKWGLGLSLQRRRLALSVGWNSALGGWLPIARFQQPTTAAAACGCMH